MLYRLKLIEMFRSDSDIVDVSARQREGRRGKCNSLFGDAVNNGSICKAGGERTLEIFKSQFALKMSGSQRAL